MKMKLKFSILFLLFNVVVASAQKKSMYDSLLIFAQSTYVNGEFEKSAGYYAEAFKHVVTKVAPKERYNAAKAMAMVGRKDSAFAYLNILLETTQTLNERGLMAEKKFESLHDDTRWQEILAALTPKFPDLAKRFDVLFDSTQSIRKIIKINKDKYGKDSKEHKEAIATVAAFDSLTHIEVLTLIDTKGFLGKKEVGIKGNLMQLLTIQMSPLAVQEKYLPIIEKAVEEKKLRKDQWADVVDRILVNKGQKQRYGTQGKIDLEAKTKFIYPIEDIDKLNERRKTVGLSILTEEQINRQKEAQKDK